MNNRAERNKKISQTLKAKRARGEVAGRVPLGFKIELDASGARRLADDVEVQLLIKVAQELHKQGISLRKIARIMAPLGLSTSPGLPLRATSLARLFRQS